MADKLEKKLGLPGRAYALPLIAAHKLSSKHQSILQQAEMLFDQQLVELDLKQLDQKQLDDILVLSALLSTLTADNSSLNNPYSTSELFQRLVKQQQQLLDQIAELKDKSAKELSEAEKTIVQQDLAIKQQTLSDQLKTVVVDITKEMTDVKKRDKAARVAASTKRADKVKHTLGTYVSPSVEGLALLVNLTVNNFLNTKTILGGLWDDHIKDVLSDFSDQVKETGAVSGLTFGFFGLISLAVLMTAGRGFKGDRHDSINLVLQAISSFLNTSRNILNTVSAFEPSVSKSLQITHSLSFLPLLGTTASLISLGIAIGNIIRTERTYEQNMQLFASTFNDETEFRHGNKLLSADELKLKEGLLKVLSVKSSCKNPDLIKSLFTRDEFIKEIKPKLLAHAQKERNKQIAKYVIGAALTLTTITLGIIIICVPAVGQIIGLALISLTISAFIGRLLLDKTILKPNANPALVPLVTASIDSIMQACGDIAQDVAAGNSHVDSSASVVLFGEPDEVAGTDSSNNPGPLVFGYARPDLTVPVSDAEANAAEDNRDAPNPPSPSRGGA